MGVSLVSLNEGIDLMTPAGRLQCHILAMLVATERPSPSNSGTVTRFKRSRAFRLRQGGSSSTERYRRLSSPRRRRGGHQRLAPSKNGCRALSRAGRDVRDRLVRPPAVLPVMKPANLRAGHHKDVRPPRPFGAGSVLLYSMIGAFVSVRRSRQLNTHNTEFREVYYPWHPWFGRTVAVYEVLVKQGQSVCRCGLEERNRLSIEVPAWMFEPAACGRLRVMAAPAVDGEALSALQTLLRTVPRSDAGGVLQAQHRSLPAAGGADAPVRDPPATLATHTLSSRPVASVVSDVAPRDPSQDDSVAGAATPRAHRPTRRGRLGTGGAR
jgi:hypothetical protein